MPEPPNQTDMRTQGLPPRHHSTAAQFAGTSTFSASAAILTVTHPGQLPAALRQHPKQIVIENTPDNAKLKRDFELLLKWQRWKDTYRLLLIVILLVLAIMQMVIANKYGLDFGWHLKWTVFELDGKITLTPP
jgi:hypothetical protein